MRQEERVPDRFRSALSHIVDRVAAGDFDGLVRDGSYTRGGDLGHWTREYGANGATVIPLPEEAWAHASAVELETSGRWSVVVDLWTQEEGRSDLSLEAIVVESDVGIRVEIENIHVM